MLKTLKPPSVWIRCGGCRELSECYPDVWERSELPRCGFCGDTLPKPAGDLPGPTPEPEPHEDIPTERCPKHGDVNAVFVWQHFKNGKPHLRAHCPECQTYIRYVPQTPDRVAIARGKQRPQGRTTKAAPTATAETRKRAVLTCRHCGGKRPAGELFCHGCSSPWVVVGKSS